jgi:hypothetical protein
VRVDIVWSEQLLAQLERLTPKQAAAVPRLAETLVRGGSVDSLLAGPGRICARQTYYGRPRGWSHQVEFQEALELAKREYRQALARDSVEEARALLYAHAPEGVRRTLEIMRMIDNPAQSRLAARDIWKAAMGLDESEDDRDDQVAITFETPEWAQPEDDDGQPGD